MPDIRTNPTFVVDASVAVSWCFPDEITRYGDTILGKLDSTKAIVPLIWPIEVANALVSGLASKRLTRTKEMAIRLFIQQLPIVVDANDPVYMINFIIPLAQKYGLTAYDMSYLELAMRFRIPLATYDKNLKKAAAAAGVTVL